MIPQYSQTYAYSRTSTCMPPPPPPLSRRYNDTDGIGYTTQVDLILRSRVPRTARPHVLVRLRRPSPHRFARGPYTVATEHQSDGAGGHRAEHHVLCLVSLTIMLGLPPTCTSAHYACAILHFYSHYTYSIRTTRSNYIHRDSSVHLLLRAPRCCMFSSPTTTPPPPAPPPHVFAATVWSCTGQGRCLEP